MWEARCNISHVNSWARFMLPRVTKAPVEKVNVPLNRYIGYSGFSFYLLKHGRLCIA